MKYFNLLAGLLLFAVCSIAQQITRGPDVGEIYFLGPTHTGTGLYYSTDYGETAICVDSTMDILTIAGDKTSGGVYCIEMPSNLYYSDNYGNANSWEVKNGGISVEIESGINPGHIFSSFYMHSEDFGSNFVYHTCNGYFGNKKNVAIDNNNDNNGYIISNKLTVADTLYLFRTFDKFENVEVIQKLYFPNGEITYLSSGNDSGEVLLYYKISNILNFSSDFAENFNVIDKFNFNNFYSFDIIGGRQTGEVYLLYNFVNLMWQNAHTYILHTTDYGVTFDVFHPFAKGTEPVLANFSTIDKVVHFTTPVEFSNFSIGDVQEYQWDFENDGIIDSYQRNPVYTYTDTGWYSVKLSVIGPDSTNTFVKTNYVHVVDTMTTVLENSIEKAQIIPNPFNGKLTVSSLIPTESYSIIIYNLNGKEVMRINRHNTELININTTGLKPGIYILSVSCKNNLSNFKIIKK